MNTATQELVVNKKGQEKVRRSAVCPTHEQRTHQYVGPVSTGWMFECQERESHMRHYFTAHPPKDAPKTQEQIGAWLDSKQQARINGKEARKRGA